MESLYFLDCPVPGYRCSVRVAYPRRNAAIHKLCSQAASDAAGDSLPHRLGDSLCPNGHRRCQGIFHRRLFLSSARFAKFPAAAGSKFSMDDTVLRLSCLRSVPPLASPAVESGSQDDPQLSAGGQNSRKSPGSLSAVGNPCSISESWCMVFESISRGTSGRPCRPPFFRMLLHPAEPAQHPSRPAQRSGQGRYLLYKADASLR